ncbi:DUF2283 domain-containing protein [Actinoplanes oblitus]|uniref:DUF2283 domain-containing protein n=1 Tax=Actinoplanes oblitus TaxID=3040509 RepID=A0ABY8WAR1_9ACTN|nr:DUF2283 domain-containing protein [Actinoplanes oblitus]WIM94944.1 DUF2283 domain-containing protein [Actinoplanes oblitus]
MRLRHDPQANAAYLEFRAIEPGEGSVKLPVDGGDGDVPALLRFAESGELLGVELLDAERQIPQALRDSMG